MQFQEKPLSVRLDEQFGRLKGTEENVHHLLQCCTMFGQLMEELNFVKTTLDMSLVQFYKERGALVSNQVQEFMKVQPSPSSTGFAITNFQKYVTDASYQYARIFSHFKVIYDTVKPDSNESVNLLDDMETFYEQRHNPFNSIAASYMEIATSMMGSRGDVLKQLSCEVRELSTNDTIAPFDPLPGNSGGQKADTPTLNEVLNNSVMKEYFHQFLVAQHSSENFLFWEEARKFRARADELSKQELKIQVHQLVIRFLSIGGENEINIPAGVRELIIEGLDNPTPDIFEGAISEVYSMMHGAFPFFEQSPEYRLMQHRKRKSFVIPVAPQKADTEVLSSDMKSFQKTVRSVHQMISKINPPRKALAKSKELTHSASGSSLTNLNSLKAPPSPTASPSMPSMTPKGINNANLGAPVNCMTLVDNYLWVGLTDSICVFNPLSMAQVKTLKHPGKVHSIIQVSPVEVWTASDGGGPIKCWDCEKFKNMKDAMGTSSFIKGEVVTCMAKIRSDMIWMGTISGMIRIWTIPKKKMVHEIKVGTSPLWHMIPQESSSSVWVAHGDDIIRFHSVSYRKMETFPREHTSHVTSMTLTEQFLNKNNSSGITTVLWTGGQDGLICLWDTEAQKCIQKFREHTDAILHLSQSKLYVFSSSFDRTTISWDKQNPGKTKQYCDGHTGPVTCALALGRVSGGTALWTGSQDGTLRAWPLD